MQFDWKHLSGYLLRLGVFIGIGAGIAALSHFCADREEPLAASRQAVSSGKAVTSEQAASSKPELPKQTAAPLVLGRKYSYANDRMVYVLLENGVLEQWSLDGNVQNHFALPVEEPEEFVGPEQLLWVDNEEIIWYDYKTDEAPGNEAVEIRVEEYFPVYSTPIKQTETGEEPDFAETRELFVCTDGEELIQGIDPDLLWSTGLGTVYVDSDYLVYQSSDKVLFAYDRKLGGQTKELEGYGDIPADVGLPSMVCGDRILYHTGREPGKIDDGLYGFCSYDLNTGEPQVIDDRCFSEAAYVADSVRNRVYYQIADDRSIWEYDYRTQEHRELISEEQFRACYQENHLLWDDAYYHDSLFVDGERLYFIKDRDTPQIFSYSFEKAKLQYEEKLTRAVRESGYGDFDSSQSSGYYLAIAEGKLLLHWIIEEEEDSDIIEEEKEESGMIAGIKDFLFGDLLDEEDDGEAECYICIDLETAEGKAVTEKDPEKVYFAMLGLWMKPGTTAKEKLSAAIQENQIEPAGQPELPQGNQPGSTEQPEPQQENTPGTGTLPVQDQLACISRHLNIMIEESEEDDTEDLLQYFAVTDLDHNGRLELIMTSGTQGSGAYTTTYYYQVSADGQELRRITDDIHDIDIWNGIKTAYVDPKTGKYYYLSMDYASAGAGARYCWYGAVILDNGMLTGRTYAETWSDWNKKKTEEVWHACHYLGGKEQKIKYRNFEPDKLADQFFKGFEKKSVKIAWFSGPKKKNRTEQKLLKKLTRSYRKFSVR